MKKTVNKHPIPDQGEGNEEIIEIPGDVIRPVIENPLPYVPLEEEEGMPVIQLIDDDPAIAEKDLVLISDVVNGEDSFDQDKFEEEDDPEEDEDPEEKGGLPRGLIPVLFLTVLLAAVVFFVVKTQGFGLFSPVGEPVMMETDPSEGKDQAVNDNPAENGSDMIPAAGNPLSEETETMEESDTAMGSEADLSSRKILWEEEARNIDQYYQSYVSQIDSLTRVEDDNRQDFHINGSVLNIHRTEYYRNTSGEIVIAVMYGELNGNYISGYAVYEDNELILVVADQDVDQYRFYLQRELLFRFVDELQRITDFEVSWDPSAITDKGTLVLAAQNLKFPEIETSEENLEENLAEESAENADRNPDSEE